MQNLGAVFRNVTSKLLTFCFLVASLVLILYVLGNYQGFLDSTLHTLLSLLRVALYSVVGIGVFNVLLLIGTAFMERRLYVLRLLATLITTGFALILVALLTLLTSLFQT